MQRLEAVRHGPQDGDGKQIYPVSNEGSSAGCAVQTEQVKRNSELNFAAQIDGSSVSLSSQFVLRAARKALELFLDACFEVRKNRGFLAYFNDVGIVATVVLHNYLLPLVNKSTRPASREEMITEEAAALYDVVMSGLTGLPLHQHMEGAIGGVLAKRDQSVLDTQHSKHHAWISLPLACLGFSGRNRLMKPDVPW
jgi:hypothetical protein